jgi:ParB-like chromosome segregation protein Spo0J
MEQLKIEYLPVSEVMPYGKNARKHGGEDVKAIVNSIKEFGFDDPIGVWGKDNVIVEGHGRLEAAKKLGMEAMLPRDVVDCLPDAFSILRKKQGDLAERNQ